nr:hypothetical protein [uncultured Brevundimonas sp.]
MTRLPHDADAPVNPVPGMSGDSTPMTEVARAKAEKAMRLASALRDNLRRRKAPQRTPSAPKPRN